MKNLPTLRQLRYFVALIDRRHFGQAAEACFVSQSTLSAGIHELEDLLGAPLFERTKRSVLPTALGQSLAGRARALLEGAEDFVDAAQAAHAPMAGALRLGVIPTIGPFILPRVMPRLRNVFPDLKLYLREDQTDRLVTQLEMGELDAVILALPHPLDGLETEEIAVDRFSVVFPPGYRTGRNKTVRPGDLAKDDLLLLEDGHCLRDHALAACSLTTGKRDTAFQGTSLHTLVQMVANGLGITLLPQMALDAGILRGMELPVLKLESETPHRLIGFAWRKSSGRKETFRRLAAVLRAELEARPVV